MTYPTFLQKVGRSSIFMKFEPSYLIWSKVPHITKEYRITRDLTQRKCVTTLTTATRCGGDVKGLLKMCEACTNENTNKITLMQSIKILAHILTQAEAKYVI